MQLETGISPCVDLNLFKNAIEQCGDCENETCTDENAVCFGPIFEKNRCSTCVESALEKSMETCASVCVETQWIVENGFEEGILWKAGVARTLCVPGLPCGTEGHLLRRCDKNGSCRLVSYKSLCEERGDCSSKYTHVSRLSAKFDWSSVQQENCSTDGKNISLTSLSIDPEGRDMGASMLVAIIGDKLISFGLGAIVDALCTIWKDFRNAETDLLQAMLSIITK